MLALTSSARQAPSATRTDQGSSCPCQCSEVPQSDRILGYLVIHFTLVMRTDMSGREPALVPVDLAGDSG